MSCHKDSPIEIKLSNHNEIAKKYRAKSERQFLNDAADANKSDKCRNQLRAPSPSILGE